MPRKIEYSQGQKIGGLIYLCDVGPYISASGQKQRKVRLECHCGKTFISLLHHVKSGDTTSCGCAMKRGGRFYSSLYYVLANMKNRCYNIKNSDYKHYGGRGIKVCDEWVRDPTSFYDWASSSGYKKGLELDRINNDLDYEPSNCRWVTHAENCRNSGTTKLCWDEVNEIRNARLLMPELTYRELSYAYKVSEANIKCILDNKSWVK